MSVVSQTYARDAAPAKDLLTQLRPFFAHVPKAKTGKIGALQGSVARKLAYRTVRSLIDELSRIEGAEATVEEITKSIITWAEQEERTFLRLNLQTTLASSLFASRKVIFRALHLILTPKTVFGGTRTDYRSCERGQET